MQKSKLRSGSIMIGRKPLFTIGRHRRKRNAIRPIIIIIIIAGVIKQIGVYPSTNRVSRKTLITDMNQLMEKWLLCQEACSVP